MKRNCYLDLRLHPSGYSPSHKSMNEQLNVKKQLVAILPHNRRQMLDVTELQARVIIWLASQEMEERYSGEGPTPTPSLSLQPYALFLNAPQGFSIKRSLRNFLQKRKKKSQSNISIATHNSSN